MTDDTDNNSPQVYPMDPLLPQAAEWQESRGDPNAVSSKGAIGSMQTLPSTLTDPGYGVTPAKDDSDEERKRVGVDYLQAMHNKFQDPTLALMAYNWGPDNVQKWLAAGGDPDKVPAETQNYVTSVSNQHAKLKAAQPTLLAQNENIQSDAPQDLMSEYELPAKSGPNISPTTGKPYTKVTIPYLYGNENTASAQSTQPNQDLLSAYEIPGQEGKIIGKQEPLPDTTTDIVKSVPDMLVKGAGIAGQLPAMGVNALTNAGGYLYGKAVGATPEQQNRLNNLNPLFVGNTMQDTLAMGIQAAGTGKPPTKNPVTGGTTYQPQTPGAQIASGAVQAAMGGAGAGIKTLAKQAANPNLLIPAARAGAVGQTAALMYPNNPLVPLAAGAVAGVSPAAYKATNFRANPDQVANTFLQKTSGKKTIAPEAINTNSLIPGVQPTLAAATQDPNIASLERNQRMQPAKQAPYAEREKLNQEKREEYVKDGIGTPKDTATMKTDRETQRVENTKNIFQPGQTADAAPVVAKIDELLNGPKGDRPILTAALNKVRKMLVKGTDEQGNEIYQDSPEKLYESVKHGIEDIQSGKDPEVPGGIRVIHDLNEVKGVLDGVIEKATPGYQKYLDDYSSASGKIDAAEYLQDLDLKNTDGKYSQVKVQKAIEKIQDLQKARGLNPAKHITPEQLQVLQNLNDDLLKQTVPVRESLPVNSTTTQNNLMNEYTSAGLGGKVNSLMGGGTPEVIGTVAGAKIGAALGWPGLGAFVGEQTGRIVSHRAAKNLDKASGNVQNFLLNPEEYKKYLLTQQNNHFLNRFQGNLLGNSNP